MGHDISKLMGRIYSHAPEVAARESRECFLHALPDQLRIANPTTLKECINNVTQTCAVLDVEEKETSKVGVSFTLAEIESKYDIAIPFTEYLGLRTSIP